MCLLAFFADFGPSCMALRCSIRCQVIVFRARLHEPGLAASPGQVASPGPPFSNQTLVTIQAFDCKKVDPGW